LKVDGNKYYITNPYILLNFDIKNENRYSAISSSRTRDAGSGYELQICSIDKNGFVKID